MSLKIVNNSDAGDADHAGGNDWDQMATMLNGRPMYSLADYFVYIDVNDSNKVKAIDCKLGTVVYTGTGAFVADVVLSSVCLALTTGSIIGGKVYVDRGTFLIGDTNADSVGFKVGGTADGSNYNVTIEGAGRDATIFKNTIATTGQIMISLRANCTLRGITFDGDNLGAAGYCTLVDAKSTACFTQIYQCRFRKHTQFGLFLANSIIASPSGFIVAHNLFELPGDGWDQFPSETYSTGWGGIISNNIFDTSKGSQNGSGVTTGASYNLVIEGNIFRGITAEPGNDTIYQGVSIEPSGNHQNVVIRDNTFEYRNINIGAYWAWNGGGPGWNPQTGLQTFRNIDISGNVISHGTIRVQGPNDVSYTGSIQNVTIEGNTILDARREGIGCRKIDARLQIRNNLIKDSNASTRTTYEGDNTGFTNPLPLIQMDYCTDAEVTDNYLVMTSAASNKSPAAIAYSNNVNPHFLRNRIINLTANPNYVVGSGNTNVVLQNWYGSSSTTGDMQDALTVNKIAETGINEKLQTWKVSDDTTASIILENADPTGGILSPRLNTIVNGDTATGALTIIGQIQAANDSGNVPILVIDARRYGAASVTARPIIDIRNNDLSILAIRPDRILHNITDELKIISAPSDPAAGFSRVYAKQIDSNNDGLFIKLKKAGGVVEVQLA